MAAFEQLLEEATYAYIHTDHLSNPTSNYQREKYYHIKTSQQAMQFIMKGTGLDLMIRQFHIELNADRLREALIDYLHLK